MVEYGGMEDTPKNSGNSSRKRGNTQNLKPWKPGQSGNPKGRRLGQRNRKTVIMEAIRKLAAANATTPEEVEELIHAAAIQKAVKGNFFFYSELSNGLYGKVTDKMDVTSGGKTLADVIAAAAKPNDSRSRKRAQGAPKVSE